MFLNTISIKIMIALIVFLHLEIIRKTDSF
jgi:hypothetical protein